MPKIGSIDLEPILLSDQNRKKAKTKPCTRKSTGRGSYRVSKFNLPIKGNNRVKVFKKMNKPKTSRRYLLEPNMNSLGKLSRS